MDEFAAAFTDADSLFVLDIYAASEQPIAGITGEALATRIAEQGNRLVIYAASFADAVNAAVAVARPGDMILTLGAGSVSQLGPQVLEALQKAQQQTIPCAPPEHESTPGIRVADPRSSVARALSPATLTLCPIGRIGNEFRLSALSLAPSAQKLFLIPLTIPALARL